MAKYMFPRTGIVVRIRAVPTWDSDNKSDIYIESAARSTYVRRPDWLNEAVEVPATAELSEVGNTECWVCGGGHWTWQHSLE